MCSTNDGYADLIVLKIMANHGASLLLFQLPVLKNIPN